MRGNRSGKEVTHDPRPLYHDRILATLREEIAMTPSQFREVCSALRGPSWQRAIADDLFCNERIVRYYASETKPRPIPADIPKRLAVLCYNHAERLISLAKSIPVE